MDRLVASVHTALMAQRRFGEYLRDAITDRGLTQTAFAKMVNVSVGHLSELISGHAKPDPKKAEEWAAVLGLNRTQIQDFVKLALLARSPTVIEREFLEMREKLHPDDPNQPGEPTP